MQVLQETTDWEFPNHTYLLDGSKLVAYIKQGTKEPIYLNKPIKGFDQRYRKFVELKANPFKTKVTSTLITVEGSKGKTYSVDPEAKTCTCPGFTFRGTCKHIESVLNV